MGKPIDQLEVILYEWPDRWLVESEGPDRDYYTFFPDENKETWPHFVDLEVYDTGWCTCRDFRFNVEPFLFLEIPHRRQCIHIIAAIRSQRLRQTKPKHIPANLQLFTNEPNT